MRILKLDDLCNDILLIIASYCGNLSFEIFRRINRKFSNIFYIDIDNCKFGHLFSLCNIIYENNSSLIENFVEENNSKLQLIFNFSLIFEYNPNYEFIKKIIDVNDKVVKELLIKFVHN